MFSPFLSRLGNRSGRSFFRLKPGDFELEENFAAIVEVNGNVAFADLADGAGSVVRMADAVAGLVGEEDGHGGVRGAAGLLRGGEEAEAEVGGVAEGKGARNRRGESQAPEASLTVGLDYSPLAAETMEVNRTAFLLANGNFL